MCKFHLISNSNITASVHVSFKLAYATPIHTLFVDLLLGLCFTDNTVGTFGVAFFVDN